MPFPIKPVHELEEHNELFTLPDNDPSGGLSSLQSFFMNDNKPTREAGKAKYSDETLQLLEAIHNSVDEVVNAATKLMNPQRQANIVYTVPKDVSDNDLLKLKTSGLISGYGRTVSLTSQGEIALRDKWLKESNNLKENRSKEKFDIRSASTNRFKKIG